jgi:hypothetical protein
MPLKPSDNPVFSDQLPKLDENSTAHADTWNQIHQPLLDNDAYLQRHIQTINQELGTKVQGIDDRLHGVESSSAVSVQKAQALDWMYRNNVINFEMFVQGYTLIDLAPVAVVQGVSGDDSLDVANTDGLRVGEFYVLSDPTAVDGAGKPAPVSALVQVQAILTGARVRLAANLARAWGASALLLRSSIKVLGASNAAAVPGDVYLTRSINIGTDAAGGAVVVRRTLSAGLARIYYRDGYQLTWKEVGWSMRRTGGDIPAGFADYEYILPMRGDGWLRMDIEGEAMTIAHVVALGNTTGLGGFINPDLRPTTPVISTPAAAAVGVMERPTLAIASYSTPSGAAQDGVQFQLSTTAAFAAILHDSGLLASGLSYALPAGVLQVGTTYYWRARVRDVAGLYSDYTAVATFATAASFAYVTTPSITGPAANAVDVPEQPTLASSPFALTAAAGVTDTHAASQWRIRSAAGTYAAPVWDSGVDAVNKLTVVVPAGKLLAGQQTFFLQVRHQGTAKGWSEWSTESKITTKAQFANVIGLVMVAPGGGAGQWARVDDTGLPKVTDASFFSSHAVYGAIQDVTISGQAMVKIPAFYVKRGTVASGPYAGKSATWISDQPATGFTLHPAFKSYGADVGQFWVGKYQACLDGSTLGSKAGTYPATQISFQDMQALAANRNVGGVSGFAMWSIYQLSAIQTLAMIEMGGSDSQSLIGSGYVNGSGAIAVDDARVATATWRGIVGLWGNVSQMVDGMMTDNAAKLTCWDRSGYKTWQTTTTGCPSNGFPVTMAVGSGASYNLGDFFWPAVTDASSANGSYGDFCFFSSNACVLHGGCYLYASDAGLFSMYINNPVSVAGAWIGTRISKT